MLNRIKQAMRKRPCDGFTVFEILIVMVLMVILSRVILPKMTKATVFDDQRNQMLIGTLMSVRSQLELYRVEHLNEYPCGDPAEPATPEEMAQRLTNKTNADHSLNGIFGSYLNQMPFNPFNNRNDLRYGSDPGQNLAGWCFDPASGKIWADDGKLTADGTAHSAL